MLKLVFLCLVLSGLQAAPLRDDVVAPPRGIDQISALQNLPMRTPVEEHRRGTEPSRRFLMDLNTGLLKEHTNEMKRRVGHVYAPPSINQFRQGTQNSRATLVDIKNGDIIKTVGEMERKMQPDVQEVRSEGLSVPVEERRQGTEPSRRFLMDLKTGLLKDHTSEMERRVGHVYAPPSINLFRQGTQNSRATLVDIRTGNIIQPVGEMERNFMLNPTSSVDVPAKRTKAGWVREGLSLPLSVPVEERRQGTEPSRRFLMDLNTGLLKDHTSEMERRVGHVYVPPSINLFRQGTQNSRATLVDIRTGNIIQPVGEMERNFMLKPSGSVDVPAKRTKAGWVREGLSLPLSVPVEERRQGTEPSRRFLMDLKTGLLKDHTSEMERRVGHVYVPPSINLFRQGTQNSRATLVDIRTGNIIQPVGEMERNFMLKPPASRKQGWRETECVGEVINGRCYHFNSIPMTFSQAEASCRVLNHHGDLASVTNSDLQSRLVSMVTKANKSPVLTWIGGVGKGQQYQWTDGSVWDYTDWMPGHPNTQRDKPACLEMFRIDESWWTAVDCQLKRASICSYPMAA